MFCRTLFGTNLNCLGENQVRFFSGYYFHLHWNQSRYRVGTKSVQSRYRIDTESEQGRYRAHESVQTQYWVDTESVQNRYRVSTESAQGRFRVGIRELKHRRFWGTDVNRNSKLLLFDAYYSLFVENFKLLMLKWELWKSVVGHENVLRAKT